MPKRVPPLSAKSLSAVKPRGETVELVDGYVPGLRVRVYPDGKTTWSLSIRDSKGTRRRFNIGSGFGLAVARRRAEQMRQAVREGANPTAERRAERQRARAAREGQGTLDALLDIYFDRGPGTRLRRSKDSKQLLKAVFSKILLQPALDLAIPDLQVIADTWRSQATASLAIRLIRPVLKWGEKRGLVRTGLAAALEQPAPVRKRERVLTRDELRQIWPQLEGAQGKVLKWLLWTGSRLNEAARMTWGEIDGDAWTIPAARAKSGKERVVPLPTQALELLRSLDRSEPAILIFSSAHGHVLSNWDRETKKFQTRSGTSGWHRHDLRRTVATLIGDLGYAPHVVTAVLGHAHIAEGATAIYARSRYQREHREALQSLADELDRIVKGESKIVALTLRA